MPVSKGAIITELTIDQVRERVAAEAATRKRPRIRLIELGELAQQTRLRHLPLFPTPEKPLQVAALYLIRLFKSLPHERRAAFYRAAYPFFIAAQGQEDLERLILKGELKKFFLSLQAFQFLAYFGEALLPEEAPGYWNDSVTRSITRSSLALLSAHYLLSPASFALRLQKLSNEAGNAFAMTLARNEKAFTEYLYEHVPEALVAVSTLFPRDVAQFVLWENALFTGLFVRGLYPDLQVTYSAIPRPVGEGNVIVSPRARLRFPKSSWRRSFAVVRRNLLRFARSVVQKKQRDEALASEGVLIDSDAGALFQKLLPIWHRRRVALLSRFPSGTAQEPYFELPLSCRVDGVKRQTTSVFETIEEQAHLRALRGAKSLRQELLDTSLQIAGGVMGQLSFTSLESLIRTSHAFYRRHDPDDTFHGHSHRVGMILTALAALYPDFILPSTLRVYVLGLLHDLGKLLIPPEVLTKKGRLDEIEWMFIRLHPLVGALLFSPCVREQGQVTCVQLAFMNLLHHENWASGGYPYGVALRTAGALPLAGRLAAEASSTRFLVRLLRIADSLDAMISKAFQPKPGERAYHVTIAQGTDEESLVHYVVKDLRARAGDWYDPALVERISRATVAQLAGAYRKLPETRGVLVPPGLAEVPGGAPLLNMLRELNPFARA